jgi:methyl-accepting chemotaxis protein
MKQTSINTLVARAGIFLLIIMAVAGGSGLYTSMELSARLRSTNLASEILRNHMEADMMHDALRADVLAALAAADPALGISIEDVKADVKEHAENFNKMIAANSKLATVPAIVKQLDNVAPALKIYIAAAESIVDKAALDRTAAEAALPDFMADFSALEGEMSDASDVISGVAEQEAESGAFTGAVTQWLTVATLIVGLLVVGLMLLAARRMLVKPIADLTAAMKKLADGDTSVVAPHADRRDEIGRMAAALALFRDNALARIKLEADQKVQDAERLSRAKRVEDLTSAFASELATSLSSLNASSSELMQEAGRLDTIAVRASESAGAAMGSTSGASSNVQSIAAAATELSASIEEISSRMTSSANAAMQAVAGGATADATVGELSRSAQSIGDIVAVISSVAAQTNLLALNATIEAARAGEAGRGFAVVASEVKTLANQTSRATDDISNRINEIQQISNRSVSEVRAVINLIQQMQEISSAVAAAAEEQSAATNGIAQNVNDAAVQADEAVTSVSDLNEATARTRSASGAVQASAKGVEQLTHQLRESSQRFFESLRAA